MAQIDFLAGGGSFPIANLSGSGLGFYGGGFGFSVDVGSFQDTTFITNSAGTAQGPQVNNVKYMNSMSGIINSASSGVMLRQIPNNLATLNIRFTHTSAVKTQNGVFHIFDRTNVNSPASGVTARVAQIIHPDTVQNDNGSGDVTWVGIATNPQTGSATVGGSGITVSLVSSPGTSGLRPNGADTTDTQHDWYIAVSVSPDSVGSKTFAGFCLLEYL
jgi:hypothetical protein